MLLQPLKAFLCFCPISRLCKDNLVSNIPDYFHLALCFTNGIIHMCSLVSGFFCSVLCLWVLFILSHVLIVYFFLVCNFINSTSNASKEVRSAENGTVTIGEPRKYQFIFDLPVNQTVSLLSTMLPQKPIYSQLFYSSGWES